MTLSDVRDYIASFGLADHVYMGKLPDKQDKSVGVYNSKHEQAYHTAIGGATLESYGIKNVTLLVHWNKSLRETEAAASQLFDAVCKTREAKINEATIKFIQPLYELQDIGTDDAGVCEMVIEMAVIFSKGKGE
ncbi:MAG: minor capsid protein [Anaerosacchariphilus sp.]